MKLFKRILAGVCLVSIFGLFTMPVAAQFSESFWYKPAATYILPADDVDMGATGDRIAKIWLDDIDATLATIGGLATGAMTITVDDAGALLVETAAGADIFNVDTVTGDIKVDIINEMTSAAGVIIDGLTIVNDGTTTDLIGTAGDYLRISDGNTTSHALSGNDDLLVTGELEVNSSFYSDGSATFDGTTTVLDDKWLVNGSSIDSALFWSTGQTNDSLLWGLGNTSNSAIVTQFADRATDFLHADQTNPTIFVHSADATDTSDYLSLTHDQTSGIISAGQGGVSIEGMNISNDATKTTFLGTAGDYNRIGDATVTNRSLATNDDLVVAGAAEINGNLWVDSQMITGDAVNLLIGGVTTGGKIVPFVSAFSEINFGLGAAVGRQLVFTEFANATKNHDHAVETNPTVFFHSATDPDSDNTEWGSITHDVTNLVLNTGSGGVDIPVRLLETEGTDIASAATIVLPTNGNAFELTGTTKVNLINKNGWQQGAILTLICNESVTIDHGTATFAAEVTILLAGAGDFSCTADDTLTLMLSSTTAGGEAWREISRTAI